MGNKWSPGCGCTCGDTACCPGTQTCLEIDLTIGTTDCCDIGDVIITLNSLSDSEDDAYCVWEIDVNEYPPSSGGQGFFWLNGFTPDDFDSLGVADCATLSLLPVCYSEKPSAITYSWFPYSIFMRILTSKTTGEVVITMTVGYMAWFQDPLDSLCYVRAGGSAVYTIESSNCFAGPFTVTDVTKNVQFRSWVPPTCDITINSIYECV